ncbi:hypothetical protein [Agromyces sp. NPDC058104]|uniref:hypothetical protein n=1 Tax=Agromyces sp. NPDC058104 TaxID=3346342 RepID=UPI0036DCC591
MIAPASLREDVSPQLTRSLAYWLEGVFGYRHRDGIRADYVMSIALMCELDVPRGARQDMMSRLVNAASRDDAVMFDVLDAVLHKGPGLMSPGSLRETLAEGHSAWTVRQDDRGLERRVDATAGKALDRILSVEELASAELAEAWSKTYGLHPDASDAWDHAIKAVEEILIPLIVPGKAKANLGAVAGTLRATPHKFVVALESPEGPEQSVQTLEGMIRLMWPNPDRHGAGVRRTPTLTEAAAVVGLAVTIVQWARDGLISAA